MDEFDKLIKEIDDTFGERFFNDEPLSMIEVYRCRDFLKKLAQFDLCPPQSQ
jgi:hypothetical protein